MRLIRFNVAACILFNVTCPRGNARGTVDAVGRTYRNLLARACKTAFSRNNCMSQNVDAGRADTANMYESTHETCVLVCGGERVWCSLKSSQRDAANYLSTVCGGGKWRKIARGRENKRESQRQREREKAKRSLIWLLLLRMTNEKSFFVKHSACSMRWFNRR